MPVTLFSSSCVLSQHLSPPTSRRRLRFPTFFFLPALIVSPSCRRLRSDHRPDRSRHLTRPLPAVAHVARTTLRCADTHCHESRRVESLTERRDATATMLDASRPAHETILCVTGGRTRLSSPSLSIYISIYLSIYLPTYLPT